MTIDTDEYVRSHGRKPRGGANSVGLWMFAAVRGGSSTRIEARGTYADAVRAAKAEARTIGGCDRLVVMP